MNNDETTFYFHSVGKNGVLELSFGEREMSLMAVPGQLIGSEGEIILVANNGPGEKSIRIVNPNVENEQEYIEIFFDKTTGKLFYVSEHGYRIFLQVIEEDLDGALPGNSTNEKISKKSKRSPHHNKSSSPIEMSFQFADYLNIIEWEYKGIRFYMGKNAVGKEFGNKKSIGGKLKDKTKTLTSLIFHASDSGYAFDLRRKDGGMVKGLKSRYLKTKEGLHSIIVGEGISVLLLEKVYAGLLNDIDEFSIDPFFYDKTKEKYLISMGKRKFETTYDFDEKDILLHMIKTEQGFFPSKAMSMDLENNKTYLYPFLETYEEEKGEGNVSSPVENKDQVRINLSSQQVQFKASIGATSFWMNRRSFAMEQNLDERTLQTLIITPNQDGYTFVVKGRGFRREIAGVRFKTDKGFDAFVVGEGVSVNLFREITKDLEGKLTVGPVRYVRSGNKWGVRIGTEIQKYKQLDVDEIIVEYIYTEKGYLPFNLISADKNHPGDYGFSVVKLRKQKEKKNEEVYVPEFSGEKVRHRIETLLKEVPYAEISNVKLSLVAGKAKYRTTVFDIEDIALDEEFGGRKIKIELEFGIIVKVTVLADAEHKDEHKFPYTKVFDKANKILLNLSMTKLSLKYLIELGDVWIWNVVSWHESRSGGSLVFDEIGVNGNRLHYVDGKHVEVLDSSGKRENPFKRDLKKQALVNNLDVEPHLEVFDQNNERHIFSNKTKVSLDVLGEWGDIWLRYVIDWHQTNTSLTFTKIGKKGYQLHYVNGSLIEILNFEGKKVDVFSVALNKRYKPSLYQWAYSSG